MDDHERADAIRTQYELGGLPLDPSSRRIGFERKPCSQRPPSTAPAWGTAPDERRRVDDLDWVSK